MLLLLGSAIECWRLRGLPGKTDVIAVLPQLLPLLLPLFVEIPESLALNLFFIGGGSNAAEVPLAEVAWLLLLESSVLLAIGGGSRNLDRGRWWIVSCEVAMLRV